MLLLLLDNLRIHFKNIIREIESERKILFFLLSTIIVTTSNNNNNNNVDNEDDDDDEHMARHKYIKNRK